MPRDQRPGETAEHPFTEADRVVTFIADSQMTVGSGLAIQQMPE
jgi:hypothetical protein